MNGNAKRDRAVPTGEDRIVHETEGYWVSCDGPGLFRVWKIGLTHSTLAGTVHFRSDPPRARARAIADANRLSEERKS